MARVAVLLALLLAGCSRYDFVKRPPAKYRADGTYFVRTLKTEDVPQACAGVSVVGEVRGPVVGCSNGVVATVPNPCEWPDPYAQLMCHELAHLRGWPANHPES